MPSEDCPAPVKCMKTEHRAVTLFREYLRIKTVQPNPDYDGAVKFLQRLADELDFPSKVIEVHPGKPCFVMTWEGTNPALPSIVLNSHMDVVPVVQECWSYDPFEAFKTENGDIYARGSQDMKCVGIQYVEAIRQLKAEGKRLLRTVHILFVPEEEVGGVLGMELFVKHEEFKKMNMGFGLDEGLANPTDAFTLFYGERSPWWVVVTCKGNPGHGSRFIEGTAAEKSKNIISSFFEFREKQENRLKSDSSLRLGDVTTVNMTYMQGGLPHNLNVIPSELDIGFDIRIPPTVDLIAFEKQIKEWCEHAGEGVSYRFAQKSTIQAVTSISNDDQWWRAFSGACNEIGVKLEKEIFPAATDCRFFRALGLPALGFSPMNNTPILLHDHNEFLNEDVFLRGIDVYCKIIPAIANVPA